MANDIQPDPLSWRPTMAVVTDCRRTWDTAIPDESYVDPQGGYSPARFRVKFSYEVDGKTYYGKYESGSPVDFGHSFEILYDPNDPASNTGSDVTSKLATVVAVVLFVGLFLVLRRYFPE